MKENCLKPDYIYDESGQIKKLVNEICNYECKNEKLIALRKKRKTKDIPKIGHFIWVSHTPITKKRRITIQRFSSLNKDAATVFWVSMPIESDNDEEICKIKKWADDNNIILGDYKYLLALYHESFSKKETYINAPYIIGKIMLQRVYIKVANISRFLALYFFGGTYMDLDIFNRKKLSEQFYKTKLGFKIHGSDPKHINNDIIAAIPGNELCLEICKWMLNADKQCYKDLFRDFGRSTTKYTEALKNYDQEYKYFDIPFQVHLDAGGMSSIFWYDVLYRSLWGMVKDEKFAAKYLFKDALEYIGPEYFRGLNGKENDHNNIDYADSTEYKQETCWFKSDTYSLNKNSEIKDEELITILMNNLYYEPRVLPLNYFSTAPHFANIKITKEKYRDLIKTIATKKRFP